MLAQLCDAELLPKRQTHSVGMSAAANSAVLAAAVAQLHTALRYSSIYTRTIRIYMDTAVS